MAARTRSREDRLVQNPKPKSCSLFKAVRCQGSSRNLKGGFERRPYVGIALTGLAVLRSVGADAAVAFVADLTERLWICVREAVEHTMEGFAHGLDGGGGIVVGAAEGLGDDLVDDAASLHVRRRELEGIGGLGGPAGIAEDYGGARFGRYNGEVGVFEHTDVVSGAHGERPAGTSLPDNDRDYGHRYFGQRHEIGRDGPRLSPLLRTSARKGAGGIHQHDHGQPEPGGKLIETLYLAVALRVGHPEIALHAAVYVGTFIVAEEDDVVVPNSGEAAAHGGVVAEEPITGELVEIVGQGIAVGPEVRTFGVAGDLHALVRREVGVDAPAGRVEGIFEAGDLPPKLFARSGEPPELDDALLEVLDRALEVEDHGKNPNSRSRSPFKLRRCTMRSTIPCSLWNSAVWKSSGSLSRVVCSMTRAPVNPILAPGSAKTTSAAVANEAVTPPKVGSVSTET